MKESRWQGPALLSILAAIFAAAFFGEGGGGRRAGAVEYNFAGSVALNSRTLLNGLGEPRESRDRQLNNFNARASLKAVVDVSPYLSVQVKVCYGCHGIEMLHGFAELTPHPAINVRFGRINPAFGDFYLRHDPASHKTAAPPMIYDMGNNLNAAFWNHGILPIPYADTGAEIFGSVRPAETLSISYAAHVVNGFRAQADQIQTNASPTGQQGGTTYDWDLRRSRFVTAPDFIVDNNRQPSVGGRVVLSFARSSEMRAYVPDVSLGGSVTYGPYDDYGDLNYLLGGVDLYVRIWRVNLRAEYVRRRMDADARNLDYPDGTRSGMRTVRFVPGQMGALPEVASWTKEGFYVETDFPLGNYFEGVLRVDGMHRMGPRPSRKSPDEDGLPPESRRFQPQSGAALNFSDTVLRYTVGLNYIPVNGAKIKLNYEYWDFSDREPAPDGGGAPRPELFIDGHLLNIQLVASF